MDILKDKKNKKTKENDNKEHRLTQIVNRKVNYGYFKSENRFSIILQAPNL